MSLLCLINCSKLLKRREQLLTENDKQSKKQYYYFFDSCKLMSKKPQPQFTRIEQEPPKNLNCFMQLKEIKETYKYEYTGSITEFNKLLTKHNIEYNYIISVAERIYTCKLELLEFEIRIRNEETNIIQFFPIVGSITEMLNIITKN